MPLNIRLALGLGGVPPYDSHRAYQWEKRLHWPMLVVTLLALPAFYLGELAAEPDLQSFGRILDRAVLLAFSAELLLMLSVTTQRTRYLLRNWLSLAIIAATASSLLIAHLPGELSALLRLLRFALAGLLIARLARQMRSITPGSTPYILVLGFGLMLLSGAGFYWMEPTVHSYWDGVWLAFTSGLTVGYGDLTPTTHAARLFASVVIVLTWMHLSDLHVSGEDWQRDEVLDALVRDLPELLCDRELRPDLLLVSGDVASRGRREDYDGAFAVLERITRVLGLERGEHVFMVPGNHDVDRSRIGGMARLHHEALVQLGAEALSETLGALLEHAKELGLYGERLSEWCAFTEHFLNHTHTITPKQP